MRISDESAPWNEGVWRVEAGEGGMRAKKTDEAPDVELSANFLAPLYTGFRTAETLAAAGMITVHKTEALAEITNAFAVGDPPFTQDYY
jgi:predicted acetyltransferase